VSRPAKESDPGGDQARHLLTRFISTPGSSDTERRKGGPSGIEGKIYHRSEPRCVTVHKPHAGLDKSNQTAEKNLKNLRSVVDGGGRLC
jgi:hypothetical protein